MKLPFAILVSALTTLLFALSLTACGGEELPGVERDEPTLVIQPQRVDFSNSIAPGQSEEATITLINYGVEILEIWDVDFPRVLPNPPNFSRGSNWPSGEIELGSMESYQFSVIYNPIDTDRHMVTINMKSNDPDNEETLAVLISEAYAN